MEDDSQARDPKEELQYQCVQHWVLGQQQQESARTGKIYSKRIIVQEFYIIYFNILRDTLRKQTSLGE